MGSAAGPVGAFAPVLVLSTGRCGSTMISDVLNRHPRVLSLSEFFSTTGLAPFRRRRPSGARMWRIYSRPGNRIHLLQGQFQELLYPVDDPASRFGRDNAPPIMCVTLPHITPDYEALFDELADLVPQWPHQPAGAHYRQLFGWLLQRFGRDVWVERSGGTLLQAARLLTEFPEARVIHIYRDGRDTAISMSRHHPFRVIVATLRAQQRWGIDALRSNAPGNRWDRLSPWLVPVSNALFPPRRLPFDQLELADFGRFWSRMIARGQVQFQRLPPDRFLAVKFEDVAAEPEKGLRRIIRFIAPELEDEGWLRAAVAAVRRAQSRYATLPAAQLAPLTEACRPGLELLGYPV